MGSRTFSDDRGVQWTVWAVEPTWAERRSGSQRRVLDLDTEERSAFDRARSERRNVPDRRRGYPDDVPRVKIGSTLEGGWLAFEGAGERRRLTPIPPDWLELSDADLNALLARASIVAARGRRLIE